MPRDSCSQALFLLISLYLSSLLIFSNVFTHLLKAFFHLLSNILRFLFIILLSLNIFSFQLCFSRWWILLLKILWKASGLCLIELQGPIRLTLRSSTTICRRRSALIGTKSWINITLYATSAKHTALPWPSRFACTATDTRSTMIIYSSGIVIFHGRTYATVSDNVHGRKLRKVSYCMVMVDGRHRLCPVEMVRDKDGSK